MTKRLRLSAALLLAGLTTGILVAAAQPAAPASSPSGGDDVLVGLSKLWMDAAIARDTATLDRLMAEDFALVLPGRGTVTDRVRWLTNNTDRIQMTRFKYSNMRVSHYGDGTAVVSSVATQEATSAGQPWSGTAGMVDVWQKRGGQWKVVARYTFWPDQLRHVDDTASR
jgi:ketosteroid isomerase-like protein